MKTVRRVGKVVTIMPVGEDTGVMIITTEGKIIRTDASDVRQVGRSASGVMMVRLGDGDQVAAACIIKETVDLDDHKTQEDEGQTNLPLQ